MNAAISFLRILSIYCVVAVHAHGRLARTDIAVPLFMALSFYLSGNKLMTGGGGGLRRRLARILIPFWSWGVIYSLFALVSTYEFGGAWAVGLLEQLILGHVFASHLYFLVLLAGYTVVLALLGRICKERSVCAFGILAAACLLLQWTGINYRLFNGLPDFARYTCGRFAELLPYAFIGCVVGGSTAFLKNGLRWAMMILLIGGLAMMRIAGWHFDVKGFGYSSVLVYLFVPILVLGLERADHMLRQVPRASEFLNVVGRLVPGVYFVHLLLIFILSDYIHEGLAPAVFCLALILVAGLSRVPMLKILVK